MKKANNRFNLIILPVMIPAEFRIAGIMPGKIKG